jgi:AcrR family transcriptional regulator
LNESQSTRERILGAAAKQFALFGFEGVSLRAIGGEVGIRAASIFHHFPGGKRELYDTITAELMELAQSRLLKVMGLGLGPAETMTVFAAAFWDALAEKPDLASLLLREAFESASERNVEKREVAGAFLREFIARLGAARDAGKLPDLAPEALVMALASYGVVAHGAPVIRQLLYGESAPSDAMRDHFLMFVRRLVGLPEGS